VISWGVFLYAAILGLLSLCFSSLCLWRETILGAFWSHTARTTSGHTPIFFITEMAPSSEHFLSVFKEQMLDL